MTKVAILISVTSLANVVTAGSTFCRNIPGDPEWPSSTAWDKLNQTVGGRLAATVPLAIVCHQQPFDNFNQDECDALQSEWLEVQTYVDNPVEVMDGYIQNQTCDPFTSASIPCLLGNRPAYSINVSSADDVVAGLRFAEDYNIRLVVKNTGHDFLGKSTGKGSLALWTHNLKDIDIISTYSGDSNYTSTAVKIGAGVEAAEAYLALGRQGYRIVGGSCLSVGLAGGYTAGGGHSKLMSKYGLAADNVLEWEVVTPMGDHLIATPKRNSDLYWALSGGGGGTYAVVISMTTKIFPEGTVGAGSLTFSVDSVSNSSVSANDTFWAAIGNWFAYMPTISDDGNTIDFQMTDTSFSVRSFSFVDQDASAVEEGLAPFLAKLDQREITYNFTSRTDVTFLEHVQTDLGPIPWGSIPSSVQLTTRLIPRAGVLDPEQNAKIISAIRVATADELYFMACTTLSVQNSQHPDNAIPPVWRDTMAVCLVALPWDFTIPLADMLAQREYLLNVILPTLEEATPGSGYYLNELDAQYKGDWKKEIYGVNYPRLLSIKQKYDPDSILYGHTAVGSDLWTTDSSGRLCKT
ncbi:putative FAD-dependent isoamyl alcohol oxidase [Xylariales sp. PMI_506]|nr:putative FAD-dependent isoamyl alcohol oxidase [Xylariales sp. PMI_506]